MKMQIKYTLNTNESKKKRLSLVKLEWSIIVNGCHCPVKLEVSWFLADEILPISQWAHMARSVPPQWPAISSAPKVRRSFGQPSDALSVL